MTSGECIRLSEASRAGAGTKTDEVLVMLGLGYDVSSLR